MILQGGYNLPRKILPGGKIFLGDFYSPGGYEYPRIINLKNVTNFTTLTVVAIL